MLTTTKGLKMFQNLVWNLESWICQFLFLTLFCTLGASKFVNNDVSSSVGGPLAKQLQPSDNFIHCYFNPACYCKYDQRTEVLDSLIRLWRILKFNGTQYQKTVGELIEFMNNDPNNAYYISPNEIIKFSYTVGNSSTYSKEYLFEPGPIFDLECSDVPIALIPTEYSTHGVISHVSITGSKLSMLDGSAFAGQEIQGIRLSRNQLYYISEYALSMMRNSLSMLDLSSNFLDEVPLSSFRSLKMLEWLNLSNNLLVSISGDWASLSNSLRKLILSSNSIDSIPYKLFQSFEYLTWIDLSYNFIRNLSYENLPPNLQTLNLMRNRFTQFPTSVFQLPSLTWLFLGGCTIETIPEDWPPRLMPLQMSQIDLSENFIQVWPARAFGAQLIVLDLSLSKNYLQLLPAASFHSMNIFRLSLGYNRLHSLDPSTFFTLETSLKYLNLENNRFRSIPWEALHNLSSLVHLYVGSNYVEDDGVEPDDSFDCKLAYLGLNGNSLSRLPVKLLSGCSHLFHLNLGYNQISHLDDLAYLRGKRLENLSTLILRNNPIRSLSFVGGSSNSAVHHHHSHLTNRKNSSALLLEDWGNNYHHHQQKHQQQQQNQKPIIEQEGTRNPNENEIRPLLQNGQEILMTQADSSSGPTSSLTSISNIIRPEVLPNLRELSLSFCQLSGELEPFPSLPITTLEISMGLKTATVLSPDLFKNLKKLEWLALDHNNIHTIKDFTFYSNPKLTYLSLEWNRLTHLPAQLFNPEIHTSITHFRLSHNKISTLTSESFLSFSATNLDLSYNMIHTIEKSAFMEINSEEISSAGSSTPTGILGSILNYQKPGLNLYLSHNRLGTIQPNAFSQERFSLIDLSFNKLQSFNFDTIHPNTIVQGLNLSNNELEKVIALQGERKYFKSIDLSFNKIQRKSLDLSDLCIIGNLDLSHNRLDKIDSYLFPTNCSVKDLRMNDNLISALDSSSFTNMRDLTVLHLERNQISRLPTITFIRNTKLKLLDLSYNRIRTLPRDVFVGSSIEVLGLGSNQFVNLPVGALSQISRCLKRLDMSHNSIEHLDSTMFESIPGLISLNLSSNRLSTLPDSAFANLGSLRELDLSENFLRANFKELFHFLPKLKVLRLASCGIKVLPYLPLPHLVSLDLSSNGLHEIKMQSLSSLTRLRNLDLSSNELMGPRLPSWTPLYNLLTLNLSKNPLKSLTRDTFYGLGRLEKLELMDMGRIDRFDSDVFSHLYNLKILSVETYPNIEKYRFRLGAVLSSISHLEELIVHIKEPILSDQLLGGILPKLRKLTIMGLDLKKIESGALEGLQNCFHMDLTIQRTSVDEVPPRIFDLLQILAWARLDLSFNKLSSLDSAALYPNKTIWFSKGTKILEGGLILDGNEFVCDCDLVWIGEWLRRWLRESYQSHYETENIPQLHLTYERIRRPSCTDSKGRIIPLIELYSDIMCHASALSGSESQKRTFPVLILIISFLLSKSILNCI